MLKGSCLCGQVRYEIEGEPEKVLMCHCQNCRKASGTAFTTNGLVGRDDFTITRGKEQIAEFEAVPGVFRRFCRNCGSPIYSLRPAADFVVVRLGTLDSPMQSRPSAHIFVGSKAEWDLIHDNLPQYEERP